MDKAVAIAPEIHDICASKAVAGRTKDHAYIDAAITTNIVDPKRLAARIALIDSVEPEIRKAASAWVASYPSRNDEQR